MKRLIASLVFSLGLILANVSSATAATRYWQLQMFDPAATTNRTINIEFKVMSTDNTDTFSVELLENGTSKEVRGIDTDYGDSGVFSVALPSTGTYTYKINATNSGDATTKTESRSVQVVDGPAPTITTVFTNNGAAGGGAGAPAAAGGAGGGLAAANAAGGAGQVAGATADEGQVSAEATSDEKKEGDVLGASEDTNAKNNRGRNIAIGTVAAVVAAGGAYYWFLARPRKSA